MKIAIFAGVEPRINSVATYVNVLKNSLLQYGHEVITVFADTEADDCIIQENCIYCPAIISNCFYGITVKQSMLSPVNDYITAFKPDIINIVTLESLGLYASEIANDYHIPVVTTILSTNDIIKNAGVNVLYDSLHKTYMKNICKRIIKNSSCVCSPSLATGKILNSININCRIRRVPFCIDKNIFTYKSRPDFELLRKINLDIKNFNFIYSGRLNYDSKVNELLKYWNGIINKKNNIFLTIVGDGSETSDYQSLTKDLCLENRVSFCGTLSQTDLHKVFSCCDAFITASTSDSVKASPLEAMSTGIPVFADKRCGNAEFISDSINGFIYNGYNELKDKIEWYYEMAQYKKDNISASARKSTAGLTYENLENIMINLYQNTIRSY